MVNTILTVTVLLVGLFDLFIWWYCLFFLRKKAKELERFVSPKAEGETSPIADVFDICAKRLIKMAMMELKTSAMGNASATARQEQAIATAIGEDALNASQPVLGALLDQVPTLKKKLMKNPNLVEMALNYLNSRGQIATSSGNHKKEPVRFKFEA